MGPINAISTAFAKIFTYSGRASRSEYWWFFLFYVVGSAICGFIDMVIILGQVEEHGELAVAHLSVFNFVSLWFLLAISFPYLSLTVRRLHDAGFSGFWTLLYFVPLGGLVLIIMHMLPSEGRTTAHGTPAAGPVISATGKPVSTDQHKRAMQGYALLFDKDKQVTPEQQAARKAEISDYYRSKVLKAAPSA